MFLLRFFSYFVSENENNHTAIAFGNGTHLPDNRFRKFGVNGARSGTASALFANGALYFASHKY